MMQSIALSEFPTEDGEYVIVDASMQNQQQEKEESVLICIDDDDADIDIDDEEYDYCQEFDFPSKSTTMTEQDIVLPAFAMPPQMTDTDVVEAAEALEREDLFSLQISEVVEDDVQMAESEKKPGLNPADDESKHKKQRELPRSVLTGITRKNSMASDVSVLSVPSSIASEPSVDAATRSKLARLSNKKRRKQMKLAKKAQAAAAGVFHVSRTTTRPNSKASAAPKVAPLRVSKRGQVAPAVAYARHSIQAYKQEVAAASRCIKIR